MSLGSSSDPWGTIAERGNSTNINGQKTSSSHTNNDPFTASPTRYNATQPPMYSPPREAHHNSNRSTDHNGYSSFPAYRDDDDDTLSGGHSREGISSHHQGVSGRSSDSNLLGLQPYTSSLALYNSMERIVVIQSEELQGNFLTRHTVYKVIQEKKGVQVLRRYSDWMVLNDYLESKYPGRMRLALPPKRMGISARHVHIPSDEQFLLRRRRGLSRYLNLLINHPIYRSDSVVRAFFTESTLDFTQWRKLHSAELSITDGTNDEASLIGKLSASQESLIPTSFDGIVATLRESLPGLIESLTRLCALLERINHRSALNAEDLTRARLSFDSFNETYKGLNSGNHAARPREVEDETIILNRDLNKLSSEIGNMAEMKEGHVNSFRNELILEERLKFQRDLWRSLLTLLNKYESKLKHDTIDKIKKRIESAQAKYANINNAPLSSRKANADEEMKKIVKNIEEDQNEIERLLNRRVFYKWTTMAEIRTIWRWSTLLRVYMQELATEGNKFYSHISRVWGGLEDALSIGA